MAKQVDERKQRKKDKKDTLNDQKRAKCIGIVILIQPHEINNVRAAISILCISNFQVKIKQKKDEWKREKKCPDWWKLYV